MNDPKFVLPGSTLVRAMGYLLSRPMHEVEEIVNLLRACEQLQEPKKEGETS